MIDIHDGGEYVIRCRDEDEIRFLFRYLRDSGMTDIGDSAIETIISRSIADEYLKNDYIALRFRNGKWCSWDKSYYYISHGYRVADFEDIFGGVYVSETDFDTALSGLEEAIGSWF